MKKLKSLSRTDLINLYWETFGTSGENIPRNRIIAAIVYGKQATYVTQEEIASITD